MDLKKLKEEYGDSMSLFGGVNCETLISGTPEEVEQEVIYAIDNAGKGGGLAISCSNTLMVGQKYRNVRAMYEAARKHGQYPL